MIRHSPTDIWSHPRIANFKLLGFARLSKAYRNARLVNGTICPHRGADLRGIKPDADGCVRCPLHALRWNIEDWPSGVLAGARYQRSTASSQRLDLQIPLSLGRPLFNPSSRLSCRQLAVSVVRYRQSLPCLASTYDQWIAIRRADSLLRPCHPAIASSWPLSTAPASSRTYHSPSSIRISHSSPCKLYWPPSTDRRGLAGWAGAAAAITGCPASSPRPQDSYQLILGRRCEDAAAASQ